jgi:hypothetical protein
MDGTGLDWMPVKPVQADKMKVNITLLIQATFAAPGLGDTLYTCNHLMDIDGHEHPINPGEVEKQLPDLVIVTMGGNISLFQVLN